MVHKLDFPFDELPVGDFTVKGKAVIEFSPNTSCQIAALRIGSVQIDTVYDDDGRDVTRFVPIENNDKKVVAALFLHRWPLFENEVRAAITRLAQNV